MKVICTIIVMILLAFSIGGCRSVKQSERLGTKLVLEEQREIKSRAMDSQQIVLSRSVLDSSGQSYQLTIYPADTFSFSMEQGFKGKATKVVLSGKGTQLIRSMDTSKYNQIREVEAEASSSAHLTEKMKSREVAVEKSGVRWKGVLIGLVMVVVLGLWWRLLKLKAIGVRLEQGARMKE